MSKKENKETYSQILDLPIYLKPGLYVCFFFKVRAIPCELYYSLLTLYVMDVDEDWIPCRQPGLFLLVFTMLMHVCVVIGWFVDT